MFDCLFNYIKILTVQTAKGPSEGNFISKASLIPRDTSRAAAASEVELFVIIVNGWKTLTIITKSSTLDAAAVLDPRLIPAISNPLIMASEK